MSGNVSLASQTHQPGDIFTAGSTKVVYLFVDVSGNEAVCSFSVNLQEGNRCVVLLVLCNQRNDNCILYHLIVKYV